jgi:2-polyprenyl-3-methyl-5-hydroxy-6-metoxy-1,4-benzoquinol methylase
VARCPVCGASELEPAFRLSRGPVEACPACGVQIAADESVDPEQDRRFHETLDESTYVAYFEPFRKGQYRQTLERLGLPAGSTLLDVGASYGWLVEVATTLGFDAYGLEPSPMTYRQHLRDRIFEQTLEEHAAATQRRYDVVTLWHVLEHLRDPFEAVEQLSDLVKDGGVALIAVPNAAGHMYRLASFLARRLRSPRLMEELWYTHNPNMHRYYPTADAVGHLLGRASLEVVDS